MKGIILPLGIALSVIACSGERADKTQSNTAPQFVTSKSLTIVEGQQVVADLEGFDSEGDTLEYSLAGGVDNSLFNLDSTGKLLFKNLPDYESPTDATNDNRYELKVRVSDGLLSSEENFTIEVLDALEGRVVDGPLAAASLFVDCNADGVWSDNEPATSTGETGYFSVEMPDNCDNQLLVSKGGIDITTGYETSMVLMAKLPEDFNLSSLIVLSPVSTVIAFADQADHKMLLSNLGIKSVESSSALLGIDPWQDSLSSNTDNVSNVTNSKAQKNLTSEIEIQQLNGQLATLIETVNTLKSDDANTSVASAVADMASQPSAEISLSNTGNLSDILDAVLDGQVVPDVILEAVASINSHLAAQTDPTGDTTIAIQASLQQLQTNIIALANNDLSEEAFNLQNIQTLTAITQLPIAVPGSLEVIENNEKLISLAGTRSNGSEAELFRIESLPDYGILRDSNGVVIESQALPYILADSQVIYSNKMGVSSDSFVFAVLDGDLKSNLAQVAIKILGINERPIAFDQVVLLKAGESADIELLGADEDGDQLRYKIVSLPEHGVLMDGDKELKLIDLNYLLPNTRITYKSSLGNTAIDAFHFVSNDGQSNSKKAEVKLNFESENNIPLIDGQKSLVVSEDGALEITLDDLIVIDTDNTYPDDYALQISGGFYHRVEGSVVIPDANFEGELTVPTSVSDGINYSPMFNLIINVTSINDAPEIISQKILSINEDDVAVLNLDDFIVTDVDNPIQDLSIKVLPGDNYNVDGVEVKPDRHFVGTLYVPILINDGEKDSEPFTATITVNAVNDAPEIQSSQALSMDEEGDITLSLDYFQVQDVDNEYPQGFTLTVLAGQDYQIVEGNKIKPHSNYWGSLNVAVRVNDGELDSRLYHTPITVNAVNDAGTIEIRGAAVVGQTLIAKVSDVDGDDNLIITYKWQRIVDGIEEDIPGANGSDYTLEDNDEGATIKVIAEYIDNQEFPNIVKSETTTNVVAALPITKRTLLISDANQGGTVFTQEQLSEILKIADISDYTLKELSASVLRAIVESKLPDDYSNPDSSLPTTKDMPILGYADIQDMFNALPISDTFGIDDREIIISELPELDEQSVGTGRATVGQSFSLAIFDLDNELKGIANIRFAPQPEDNSSICINPDTAMNENLGLNPVVLVHGWNAFGRAKTLDAEGFNKVAKHLSKWHEVPYFGHTFTFGPTVFTTEVAPWGTIEQRGEQLIAYIQCILDIKDYTGTDNKYPQQVDLITHSMGGPTARYAAYWLDHNAGDDPGAGESTYVRSVSAIAGTHFGGNVHITSKAHLYKLYGANEPFYQATQLAPSLTISDILFKFIPEESLGDENEAIGKQYQLAIKLLEKLYKQDGSGLIGDLESVLAQSKAIMEELVGTDRVLTTWGRNKEAFTRLLDISGLRTGLSEFFSNFSNLEICIETHPDYGWCTRIKYDDLIDDAYDGLWSLESASNKLRMVLGSDYIRDIFVKAKTGITVITEELRKLDTDQEPDYYAIVRSIADIEKATSDAYNNPLGTHAGVDLYLSDLHIYIDDFAGALLDLKGVLAEYMELPDLLSSLSEYGLAGVSGLKFSKSEAEQLQDAISSFSVILSSISDLVEDVNDIINENWLDKILFQGDTDIEEFLHLIATLLKASESLLAPFKVAIWEHNLDISNIQDLQICERFLRPGTCKKTSLQGFGTAVGNLVGYDGAPGSLVKIDNAIADIKGLLAEMTNVTTGQWQDFIDWEVGQIETIQAELLGAFLGSDAAAKYNVTYQDLNDCLIENNDFQDYLAQQLNKEATDPFDLPIESFLSKECAGFVNNLVDALIERLVPITESVREEIKVGLYGVSHFGSQMFNLKYPDTGITLGNFGRCIDEEYPDDYLFSNGGSVTDLFNNDRSGKTKYYSWVNQRDWNASTWSDRLNANIVVPINNPRVSDEILGIYKSFTDLSAFMMISRDRNVYIEGEQTIQQINELMEHTDFLVHVCGQELGQVVGRSDLNHAQSTNNSLRLTEEIEDFFDLLMGGEIGVGNISIVSEMSACNQSNDLITRNTCLIDLFPRVLIMYGLYKTKTVLEDANNDGLLDMYDLLLGLLTDEIEIREVYGDKNDDNYVPKIFSDLLEAASD